VKRMPVPGAAASRSTPSLIIASNASGASGAARRDAHVSITVAHESGGRALSAEPSFPAEPSSPAASPGFPALAAASISAAAGVPSRRKQLDDFPGPLTPGSGRHKEAVAQYVSRQIDACLTLEPAENPEGLQMLWGALQVMCGNQGHLCSVAGDHGSAGEALAKLLVPDHSAGSWSGASSAVNPLQQELQVDREKAFDLQQLLIMGKRKEALKLAVDGKLWGIALLLGKNCGEKEFLEVSARMAVATMVPGSPLHTLSMVLAGKQKDLLGPSGRQPSDAQGGSGHARQNSSGGLMDFMGFKAEVTADSPSTASAALNGAPSSLLGEWRENLAILASNYTGQGSQLICSMGDRLWKERSDVHAAQLCYLIAGVFPEALSQGSKLCLIGGDHRRFKRTYASSLASIQRTEIYEWSKACGNSQYSLTVFQPYRLQYALELLDHGKTLEAYQYCSTVLSLQGTGQLTSPLQICRMHAADLSEILQVHLKLKGIEIDEGFSAAKVLGNIGGWFNKVVGGAESFAKMSASQAPSTRTTPEMSRHASSDSLGRGPTGPTHSRQDSRSSNPGSDVAGSGDPGADTAALTRKGSGFVTSLGKGFGAIGGALRGAMADSSKQAKLGADENTFFFDKELGVWREKGKEAPATAAPPPPPPTGMPAATPSPSAPGVPSGGVPQGSGGPPDSGGPPGSGAPPGSGGPPLPPGGNRFSSQTTSRRGARSRYVDAGVSVKKPAAGPGGASPGGTSLALPGPPMAGPPGASPSFVPFVPPASASNTPSASTPNAAPEASNANLPLAPIPPGPSPVPGVFFTPPAGTAAAPTSAPLGPGPFGAGSQDSVGKPEAPVAPTEAGGSLPVDFAPVAAPPAFSPFGMTPSLPAEVPSTAPEEGEVIAAGSAEKPVGSNDSGPADVHAPQTAAGGASGELDPFAPPPDPFADSSPGPMAGGDEQLTDIAF